MKVKVSFPNPRGSQNYKAIREQLLLDSTGSGVESALFHAAEAAAGPDQKVFVTRSYGPSGRLSVLIVDPVEPRNSKERKSKQTALQEALGRVTL